MNKKDMLDKGHYTQLKDFLEESKDYYIDDCSVMVYAVKNYDNLKVAEVVDAGFYIDHRDKDYNTALMYAAKEDNLELVEYLVKKKALVRVKNLENQTALDIAIMNNSFAVSRYLLELYDEYTQEEARALEILSEQGLKFKNAMHYLNSSSYEWVSTYKGNVIIKKEDFFFIYWNEQVPFKEVIDSVEEEIKILFIVDENVKNFYEDNYEFEWIASCNHYHLDDISNLEELKMEFDDYTEEDVDFIFDNYPGMYDYGREYVKLQVQTEIAVSIKENGKLIACAFCHDDGSLGGLFVIEEMRNKGYAKQISSKIIREVFRRYNGVYVDIKKDNIKSTNLSEGIGFKKIRSNYWFEVKR